MTDLTIEQLALQTGMSVRNIRNHQSRGLLPPPDVRGRVGYYGADHVERLRLIAQLQAEGFKLDVIKRLVGDGGADRFVGLRRLITAPFETEAPKIVDPHGFDSATLERAVKLGILVPLGDGRYEAPSPALLRAAAEVASRGIALDAALDALEKVQRACTAASRAFVDLFLEELWNPFAKEGRPEERWPEITEAIERLRPLASEALLATFKQTMAAEVEQAFGKALRR